MIGNDVVDLKLANLHSKWNKDAFQEKVLHPKELKNFKNKVLSFQQFWKIWSCKESAYKAHQREFQLQPKINPSHFYVNEINETHSEVYIKNSIYKIESVLQENFIYSFTRSQDDYSIQNFKLEGEKYTFINNLKRNNFNAFIIKDKNGIPFLQIKGKLIPISITHHGEYLAVLIQYQQKHLFSELIS